MRYFLIGFMGSGKSSIGKQLAKELNIKHIELDDFIEESENITISGIFNNSGEDYFRELEEKYLQEIIKEDNILVSTGGGTPTIHGLMDIMNNIGETIHLEWCTETLFERLHQNKEKRPMISILSDESLMRYIRNKLEERNFFYKKATHTICNNSGSCVNKIIDVLG